MCRNSVLVPFFKDAVDLQKCRNYSGIKLFVRQRGYGKELWKQV